MKKLLLLVVLLSFSSLAFAANIPITIDFEEYPAFTQITNQYAVDFVDFTNALQLVYPCCDEADYPPHSGNGVITNDPNDPIQVSFTAPVLNVSGWYSAPGGMTVTAYDGGGNVLATFVGADTNMSNAPFSVSAGSPIAWVAISANLGADNETVDDLHYTVVPEPSSLALLGTGALGLAGVLRRRISR